MDGRVAIVTAKVPADVGLPYSSGFPTAIKMLEALTAKAGFGLIAENQVNLGQRCITAEVPSLANLEVPDEVCRYVRPKRNRDERIE